MKYNSDVSFKMMEKYSKGTEAKDLTEDKIKSEITDEFAGHPEYLSDDFVTSDDVKVSNVNWGSIVVNVLFFALCVMMAVLETESSKNLFDEKSLVPLWKSLFVYVGAGISTKLVAGFFCYFTFDLLDKKLNSMENKPPFSFRFVYESIKLVLFIFLFAFGIVLFRGMAGI